MLPGYSTMVIESSGKVRYLLLTCSALFIITMAVYMQTGNHQFVFDDEDYVTSNLHVAGGLSGENILWAFTSSHSSNWHPVTWLSHMTDVQLFEMNPRGHHLVNVSIHAIASLLLLFLLFRLTGVLWQSAFVAALFALHPLHVESVAWVAERKDVLSAFFWFVTLLFYTEYAAKRKLSLYLAALLSFILGLMSKPMLVTLPIVMLLMDYWPLNREGLEQRQSRFTGRVPALIKEKIPFFFCSLFSGLITIYAQHKGGATRTLEDFPFLLRTENALTAYVTYIFKTVWPHDLAVYYPFHSSIPLWQVIGSLLVLLLVSIAVIRVGRRFPYLPVGWFWFVITLLPVIGLLQVGSQSMADRYMYIPVIGLFIIAAWGSADLAVGLKQRKTILALLAGVVIIASAALAWRQTGYWRDEISLYRHTLRVTPGNYFINFNLGHALAKEGDLDGAIREFQETLRIKPDYAKAHSSLGIAFTQKGHLDAAIREYQEALRINPDDARSHSNLGIVFARKGNLDAAILEFEEAVRISPDFKDARNNLVFALEQKRSKPGE